MVGSQIFDGFELLVEHLVYVDSPLEGMLRSRDGELYAFRVRTVVVGCVWHWVLLRAESTQSTVASIFDAARDHADVAWLSVLEDRRNGPAHVTFAWLENSKHPFA